MTVLVTSDLHITDSPRDEYRWQIFPWLRKQVKKTGAKHVLILGDLTDAKDRHSAYLVNRLVTELIKLTETTEVRLLRGNHDFIDENHPFFEFLKHWKSNFRYVNQIEEYAIDDGVHGSRNQKTAVFLPCTRHWQEEWRSLEQLERLVGDFSKEKKAYIFTHQTFDGALSENGTALRGVPPGFFKGFQGQVISGDIHVPQRINDHIQYVGSPYRIHFGDTFTPQILLLKKGEIDRIPTDFVSRELIEARNMDDVSKHKYPEKTQVKIRFHLKRPEFGEKPALREAAYSLAEKQGWEVCGLEFKAMKVKEREQEEAEILAQKPADVVRNFAKVKKLDKSTRELGMSFIETAQGEQR